MRRSLPILCGLGTLLVAAGGTLSARQTPQTAPAQPQTPAATPAPSDPATSEDSDGIPITSPVVKRVCRNCHKEDGKGRMSRISFRRTTPEGWQETVRRMVTLNDAPIQPDEAREAVKYLSDHLGLAPEELKPGLFEVERRLVDYKYTANTDTANTCSSCHSMGRILLQRRTGEEWNLVVAMHRGYYPLVDGQAFRRGGPPATEPGPDGRPPDNRHPMDKALAHLKSAFPLTTPEWAAWSATMRSPRLEGQWALSGYEAGEGPLFGTVALTASPASPDEFTTDVTFTYARSGRTVKRQGRSIIYTGYQWRGRSTVGGDDKTSLREVMFVERDWQTMTGRWFRGGYDELGLDIALVRVGRSPIVSGVDRPSLRRGTTGETVKIYGAGLPATLAPRDVDFGAGVTVTRVVSSTPELATVEVSVAADAPVGTRDLFVSGVLDRTALAVYDKIDYIKVTPGWNMARTGGGNFPKMFAQFEAMAYSNGLDGKPGTKDDVNAGYVTASWSMEEYTATYDDDDIKFVGAVDAKRGLFTPALDGPNPQRSGNRNNVGDVWVVATYQPPSGTPMRARAHLVVTVPLFMRWDLFTTGTSQPW
jgi:quinohemoprotein amine dehydrogenase